MNVIKKYLPLIFLICTSATGYAHSNEVIAPVGETIIKFIELGFLHIIPKGMDHILFVIGLYFLCKNTKKKVEKL